MNALISITEINSLYDQRPIIEKQASYAFVHPFAEAFGGIVSDIPVKFVAAVVFNVIYYFLAGLVGSCKILIRAELMGTALRTFTVLHLLPLYISQHTRDVSHLPHVGSIDENLVSGNVHGRSNGIGYCDLHRLRDSHAANV
jgi:hypothetical protein